ncbi:MAG TPA: Pvc16 family protein [Chloroflexia bacterium]|nr:Pvc16 family protein [Chloroflexia bacterium]
MIESLDETIKQLLIKKMPLNQAEVDISFDVPNREWSGSISKPTINIYLHDIRENVELRTYEWSTERSPDGRITKTKLGGRIDLSYIITAWTTNVEDEHRLLWYVLATLIRYPTLPPDVLEAPLQNQPFPLLTKVAQSDGILRNTADVWTALDNQLKPVLPYVVTMALDSHFSLTSREVRSKFLRINPPESDGNSAPEEGLTQIGGRVLDAANPARQIRAEVILLEQGLNSRTDEQGRFTFGSLVTRPRYTLLAVAPGYQTTRQEFEVPSSSYDLVLQPETEVAQT